MGCLAVTQIDVEINLVEVVFVIVEVVFLNIDSNCHLMIVHHFIILMSLCVRKPTICMGENKDADQLRGNREADQRLCFRYLDSTISRPLSAISQ